MLPGDQEARLRKQRTDPKPGAGAAGSSPSVLPGAVHRPAPCPQPLPGRRGGPRSPADAPLKSLARERCAWRAGVGCCAVHGAEPASLPTAARAAGFPRASLTTHTRESPLLPWRARENTRMLHFPPAPPATPRPRPTPHSQPLQGSGRELGGVAGGKARPRLQVDVLPPRTPLTRAPLPPTALAHTPSCGRSRLQPRGGQLMPAAPPSSQPI